MRKYIILFKQVASQFSSYRLHILTNFLYNFVTPIVTIAALSLAKATSNISSSYLVTYYLVVLLFLPFLNLSTQDYLSSLTFSGEINNFLMKPINLYKWLLIKEISEKFVSLIIFVPVGLIIFLTSLSHSISIGPNQILQLLLVLTLSFVLSFNLAFFVGIFSFWIDEFWTVSNIKSAIIALLGGVALPYVFFPNWIANILHFTIFPYIISWPARMLSTGLKPDEVLIALAWIIISFAAIKLFLQFSINKYSLIAG